MAQAKLRKVGGSAMVAIPPEMLDNLHLRIGSTLDLAIADGALVVRSQRRKYSLDDLLAEEASAGINPSEDFDRSWEQDPAAGRETW